MKWSPVKVKIIERGLTLRQFAGRIGMANSYWLVCKVLDGTRHSRRVQEATAAFLGETVEALFGDNSWIHHQRQAS